MQTLKEHETFEQALLFDSSHDTIEDFVEEPRDADEDSGLKYLEVLYDLEDLATEESDLPADAEHGVHSEAIEHVREWKVRDVDILWIESKLLGNRHNIGDSAKEVRISQHYALGISRRAGGVANSKYAFEVVTDVGIL